MKRIPIISLAFIALLCLTSCHDRQSDQANEVMNVDENMTSTTIQPPYLIFCPSKDPTQDPAISLTYEWPTKPPKPPKGYKHCTVKGAV